MRVKGKEGREVERRGKDRRGEDKRRNRAGVELEQRR